ncbi:hypothetical protein LV779_06005 [Streptomyces thinghirensis]|nr:hypothetical protein [Streptomyces thinghirensis]
MRAALAGVLAGDGPPGDGAPGRARPAASCASTSWPTSRTPPSLTRCCTRSPSVRWRHLARPRPPHRSSFPRPAPRTAPPASGSRPGRPGPPPPGFATRVTGWLADELPGSGRRWWAPAHAHDRATWRAPVPA